MMAKVFECRVPEEVAFAAGPSPDGVLSGLRMVGEMTADVRAVDQHAAAGIFADRCARGVRPSRIDGRDVAAYCLGCRGPVYAGAWLGGGAAYYCAGPCGLVIGATAFQASSHD